MGRINRYIWFLFMIIIGGVAGLYYSWYVKPADFVDAALYNLRPDYKTDYVLMVAEIYDMDHDRFQALVRLDKILAPSDPSRESVVEAAIENAQNLGYNPVDLQKLYRLQEIISGERAVPTDTPVPAEPVLKTGSDSAEVVPQVTEETAEPTVSGAPVADSDPFGTGVIITTDPNAAPMLDLPPAPVITPRGDTQDGYSSLDDSFGGFGTSGFSDNYFGGF